MNEKSRTILRIAVAAYLIYTGVSLIYSVVQAKPNNMILMICFGVFFVIFGGLFGGLGLKDYFGWEIGKKAANEEAVDESATYAEKDTEMIADSTEKKPVGVANIDLKATELPKAQVNEEETIKENAEEPMQEPEKDTSVKELTVEEEE